MTIMQDMVSTTFDICSDFIKHRWRSSRLESMSCTTSMAFGMPYGQISLLRLHTCNIRPWTIKHCWLYYGWTYSGHLSSFPQCVRSADECSRSNERWWRTACWDLSQGGEAYTYQVDAKYWMRICEEVEICIDEFESDMPSQLVLWHFSVRVIDDAAANVQTLSKELANGWNMRDNGLLDSTTIWPKRWRQWQQQQRRLLSLAMTCMLRILNSSMHVSWESWLHQESLFL